jgi:ubiquinone/menaquinone biosynthesis C-methylase UbiE
MSQSAELQAFYENYYDDEVARKRAVTAHQSVDHIESICGTSLGRVLDVGAGDGATLQEIERRGYATSIEAVEISSSGINRIKSRQLKTLTSVQTFDGYKLPYDSKCFDLALAIHVLEHVEHERLFLNELKRVSKRVFVEVPLEHTFRLRRSIALGKPFGHINHYTFGRFLNLLDTCGLIPVAASIFSNSLAYETFVGGKITGSVKHAIRSTALKAAPAIAPSLFVYLGAAMCE